jgi:TolB-like protein/DNA-binding winged helix-turn-helix (wHTH) protein/tetratricopeptide (TPR) repeat protein
VTNRPSVYAFADLTLDLARGTLRRGGREVELRPKAFNLLAHFAQNPGRVIPKAELLDTVWPDVVVTEGSLNQCVAEIRKALGEHSAALLRTVPRRGFLFADSGAGEAVETGYAGADADRDAPVPDADRRADVAVATAPANSRDEPPRAAGAGPPSVAVLPFANLSGDVEQEYFADGVVEEITTALGHFRRIFVVARNSSFTYKGRPVDVRDVGRELGVRYVVEGSVRRAGKRLRIAAQLIEAETGVQLWGDRLDGIVDDVFRFQDSVTHSIIGAIAPRLFAAEVERARGLRTERMDAYDLYLRALPAARAMTREGNDLAFALVERALEIDPDYAVMAALGAWAHTLRSAQGWEPDTPESQARGLALARRALARGQDDAEALSMAGYAIGYLGGDLHGGLRAIERAIDLNPNDALAFANRGWLNTYLGRADTAIASFQEAIRLSPRDPALFRTLAGLGYAYLVHEDFENAVAAGRRASESNPNFGAPLRVLAASLAHLGRLDEARQSVDRLMVLDPALTVESFAARALFVHSGKLGMMLDGLRKAGLRER